MPKVPEEHRRRAPKRVTYTVIVVSTSRHRRVSRGEQVVDVSGDLIVELMSRAGHVLKSRLIVPDDVDAIREAVMREVKAGVDVVILSGGTGVASRDVTIEAVKPLLDKELPGFSTLFTVLSYEEVGAAAMLSRSMAGVCERAVVFCLPGSPDAVRLALEKLIIPEVTHIVKHVRE